tara:strand:+ start:234 stop:524 length:291 start_codon:yes stop_codon:yes gene_type:complete
MTTSELAGLADPSALSLPLQALWHDRRGDWETAHELAQKAGDPAGDWVHAYLHRKEGDTGNAGYWYARAGRPAFEGPLDAEWGGIADALLAAEGVM